jgi:microcystin-dependent protein
MSTIKYILFSTLILFSISVKSQIGVNTLTPDNSAALDIQPPAAQSAGILIPRLTQGQRTAIPLPAKGLMVFDLTDNLFYVNLTAGVHNWYAIDPWVTKATTGTPNVVYTHSTVTNVGIGTPTPSVRLDVNGSIKSNSVVATQTLTANTITVPGFGTNPLVPTGLISMFSGTLIPAGWGLCDGTVQGGIQTPDLRGRFVIGFDTYSPPPLDIATGRPVVLPSPTASVTPATAPNDGLTKNYGKIGNTGGEIGHVLLSGESGVPTHVHTVNPHSHPIGTGQNAYEPGGLVPRGDSAYEHHSPQSTDAVGLTTNANAAADALAPHENRPPYYVLAYIIKLP